jgi:tetratricopeptide (TPR) repeat protein
MSPSPLDWLGSGKSISSAAAIHAELGGVAVGRDIRDSTIIIKRGLDEEETSRLFAGVLGPIAEKVMSALADQVAREKGIPEPPLRAILAKLGHGHVPDYEIPERLNAAADQLIALRKQLGRLGDDRPELATIRAQALELIDRGDIDGARQVLRKGRDAVRCGARLREAEFLADEARLDTSELDFEAAAAKYAEAAELVAPFDQQEGRRLKRQQAQALRDHAGRFGDEHALLKAIDLYRQLLAVVPRGKLPIEWAATQIDLGNALRSLGTVAPIEEAIAACREALVELAPAFAPVEWVDAHICVGFAFWALGCLQTSETDQLEEQGIAAFRTALQGSTRERDPVRWSTIQLGLGNALAVRSWSDCGMERLEQSAAAYREALIGLRREHAPLRWASIQNNLANVLGGLGDRQNSIERLEEAVAACREALKEHTRERWPLSWAMSQMNLGAALSSIGARESGTARLEDAVAAFREALKELARETGSPRTTFAQIKLADALCALGEREGDTVRLEEAAAVYRQALQERPEGSDANRSSALAGLGDALRLLGERESGIERLDEAAAAYQHAIEGLSRERQPRRWAGCVAGRGIALMHSAERTGKASMAETAIQQIEAALEVYGPGEDSPAVARFKQHLCKAREVRSRLEVNG